MVPPRCAAFRWCGVGTSSSGATMGSSHASTGSRGFGAVSGVWGGPKRLIFKDLASAESSFLGFGLGPWPWGSKTVHFLKGWLFGLSREKCFKHCMKVMSRHVTSYNIISYMSIPFMSCHVMLHHVTLRYVTACKVMSRHGMSCPVTSCHVMLCLFASCQVMSSQAVSYHVTSRPSRRVMSCRVRRGGSTGGIRTASLKISVSHGSYGCYAGRGFLRVSGRAGANKARSESFGWCPIGFV